MSRNNIYLTRQILAVQAALYKVSTIFLEYHLNSFLITAVRGEDPEEREHVLQEVVDVFSATVKAQILGTVATSNSKQALLVSALHFLSIQ